MKQIHTFDSPDALGLGPDHRQYQLTLRLEGDEMVALMMGATSVKILTAILHANSLHDPHPIAVDQRAGRLLADYQPGWGEEDIRVEP